MYWIQTYFQIKNESLIGRLKSRYMYTFLSIKICEQFYLKSK